MDKILGKDRHKCRICRALPHHIPEHVGDLKSDKKSLRCNACSKNISYQH